MKAIRTVYLVLLTALVLLWLLAERTVLLEPDLSTLRLPLLNLTGVVAIGTMSACLILVLRSPRVDALLGGLDKSYRLHKWLGISSLLAGALHWSLVKVPELAMDFPALEPPAVQSSVLLELFRQQYGIAVQIGDTAFKVFVILVVLALVKRFPYQYFFKTHKLLAPLFLFLVYHSVVLLDFGYWHELLGPLLLLMMVVGALASLMSLFRRIGRTRRVVGVVDEVVYLEDGDVLKVVIEFKEQWPGHAAGQFAFVTFDRKEGPHPFTISSPWTNNGKLFFLVKGLGDYTQGLHSRLNIGDFVEVEGPYGQFDFDSGRPRQIWIAGGIGIAPFVARAKQLAEDGGDSGAAVDVFYSTSDTDELMLDRLTSSCAAAGINLHLIVPKRDGHLDFQRITEEVPAWREADFWFCGPTTFGAQLRKDACAAGTLPGDFHQELFEMR